MKRIRVKLKIWMLWKNITIAFRPVYLIAFSFSLMIVFDAVMIAIMSFYSDADLIYKICSNLILGSTASFIVAIIIEMAHNYQINRRKDLELNEFYGSLYSFLSDRIFEMGLSDNSLLQHYSKEPLEDCVARPGEIPKEGQMAPKDEIQVLWDHFSEIIKSCQDTYINKREYLSHIELNALMDILSFYSMYIKKYLRSGVLVGLIGSRQGQEDNYLLKQWIPSNILPYLSKEFKDAMHDYEFKQALDKIMDIIFDSKDLMQVAFDDFEVGEKYIIDEDEEDSEKDSDKAEESINFDNESIISGALKRILEEIDILESEAEKMPSGFFVHFEKNELKRQKKKYGIK